MESNRTKVYVTLISIAAALLLLAVGAWLFLTSERPEIKELRDAVTTAQQEPAADPMNSGLAAMAAGDLGAAESSFRQAAAAATPRSERAQWVALNLALCAVLAGNADAARDRWRELSQTGLFSDRKEDRDLANMFLDAADFGMRGKPIRLGDLRRYPQAGPGSLVFFVAGVTSWSLGEKEEAKHLLAKFLEIPPASGVDGWETYRKVAERLMAGS